MAEIGITVVVRGVAEARRAIGNFQSDINGLQRAIGNVSGTTSQLGTNLQSIGNAMIGVGRSLTVGVTAPILAAAAAAVTAGIDFEDAFAGVGKTVEGVMDSAGNLTDLGEQIRQEFRDMALDIPIATNELASLGEVVGQLGIRAEDVAKVTETIAMLGATTELAAEDAAKGLIRFGNILSVESADMAEFLESAGSAIVALGNASVSTEGEILNLGLRLAAAGERANFSAQEILAWATTLSDLGVRAEAGGSAVSRAINEMLLAINTGSDNLATFAAATDTTVENFVQAFEEDASTALSHFISKLKEGIEDGSVSIDMLNEMGLSGIRAMDILGRLGNAEELFAKNLDIANQAWAEQIALEEEFNKRAATVKSQIQLLKNSFTDLGITIFDLVKDDITAFIAGIRQIIENFKNLDPSIQRTILQFAAIAAAVGPLLIVLGGMVAGLGLFVSGLVALATPAGLATAAVIGLTGALAAIALPNLGGLLGDLDSIKNKALEVGRALGFVVETPSVGSATPVNATQAEQAASNNKPEDSFQIPTLDTFMQGLKDLGGNEIAAAIENLGRIGDSFGRIFAKLAESPTVSKALASIAESFGNVGKALGKFAFDALEGFADFLETHEDNFVTAGEAIAVAAAAIAKAFEVIAIAHTAIIGIAWDVIGNAIAGLFSLITGDWEGAGEDFNAAIDGIVVGLGRLGSLALELGTGLAGSTPEEFVATWEGNLENLQIIFDTWWSGFSASWSGNWEQMKIITTTVWDNIKKAVESKTAELTTGIQSWWAGFTSSWSGNWDQVKTIVSTVWDNIKKSVESRLGDIKAVIDGVTASITSGIEDASSAIQGPIDSIATNLATAGDAFGELGGAAGAAAGAVQGAAEAMIAAMESVLASITGSPELAIQHPFEDFSKFLEVTPFNFDINMGSEVTGLMDMLSSANAPTNNVTNNSTATNISIGDISGVPMREETDLPDLLASRLTLLGAG